jgi:hypothetical protein
MTVTISLPPDTEAKLRKYALDTGKDISSVVVEAVEQRFGGKVAGVRSGAEFKRLMKDFFAANPESLPPLPADFSRADIYSDHD